MSTEAVREEAEDFIATKYANIRGQWQLLGLILADFVISRGGAVTWVSVEERLPEGRGFYMVTLPTVPRLVMESEFWAGKFHRMGGDYGVISEVTHWSALPSPPAAPQETKKE